MSINNSPILNTNCGLSEFRFWCQKVLPLVYDDSLSYYETLCKIANKLNEAITSANTSQENIVLLKQAYDELLEYINDYTKTLDETIVNSVNEKINNMAESGELYNYVVSRITPEAIGASSVDFARRLTVKSELTEPYVLNGTFISGGYRQVDNLVFVNLSIKLAENWYTAKVPFPEWSYQVLRATTPEGTVIPAYTGSLNDTDGYIIVPLYSPGTQVSITGFYYAR